MLIPIFAQYKFNLNFNVLKFQDIYEVRSETGDNLALIGYLYNWLAKVIIPVLIAFSLIKKHKLLTIFGVSVLLYLFIAQAHKSVFFGIIIVLFFYFIKNYYKKITFFIIILLLVFISTHILTYTTGIYAPESILIRRVFFVPALLNTYYFDFFDQNYIYLSHSIFKNFLTYPFDVPPPAVIGMEYFNSEATNANNGFISDGFMNFGYFGVILYSILVVILFKFFDILRLDSRYFGIFFVIIFTLISSAFLTSLLTHGILVLILLAIFIMQNQKNK
ncbi:MAG: oligosaccharide repeat unit polymerase [Bacteroidales bacterium]|nr:oligosaccharide repeat unit polymerase [Bacteroidales bacterium]